jgi:hypothetical protein
MLFASVAPFAARAWMAARGGVPLLADLCLGARFEAAGAASAAPSAPNGTSPIEARAAASLPQSLAAQGSVAGDTQHDSGGAERSCCALCLPHGGSLALDTGHVPSLGVIPAAPLRLSATSLQVATAASGSRAPRRWAEHRRARRFTASRGGA